MTKRIFSMLAIFMIIALTCMPITVSAANAANKTDTFGSDDISVTYGQDGTLKLGDAYGGDNATQESVWNKIFTQYKGIIMGVTGIGTLTMVILFIFNFMQLGKSATNPQERQKALTGLLWTGLAAAGLGGVTIFVGLAQNLLK